MICPLDRTPLIPNKRDGIGVESCLQCHGVWFSRAALESLARKAQEPATAEPPVPSGPSGFVLRRLACPVCADSQLQTRTQGDIEISRCRDCGGIWLAKLEVEKILSTRKSQPKQESKPAGAAAGAGSDSAEGLGDFLAVFLD